MSSTTPIRRFGFGRATSFLVEEYEGQESLVAGGGVVSTTDATYGNVASFDGTSNSYFNIETPLTEIQGSNARTFCYWCYRKSGGLFSIIHANGDTSSGYGGWRTAFDHTGLLDITIANGISVDASSTIPLHTWTHVAETYDGTNLAIYINGTLSSTTAASLNTTLETLSIGKDLVNIPGYSFVGNLLDFRVYNYALSASDLSTLIGMDPNPSTIYMNMYTHVVDLTWDPIPGASEYTLKYIQDNDGVEQTLTTTTGLEHTMFDLNPGSSYEFRIYSDLDTLTPGYVRSRSASLVDATNVNALVIRLSNNFTLLSDRSFDEIEDVLRDTLMTGEVVMTPVGDVTFVSNTDSYSLLRPNESVSILTPFQEGLGSTQEISVETQLGTYSIGYDDATDEVVSNSSKYAVGDYFVLDNYKVTVKKL